MQLNLLLSSIDLIKQHGNNIQSPIFKEILSTLFNVLKWTAINFKEVKMTMVNVLKNCYSVIYFDDMTDADLSYPIKSEF